MTSFNQLIINYIRKNISFGIVLKQQPFVVHIHLVAFYSRKGIANFERNNASLFQRGIGFKFMERNAWRDAIDGDKKTPKAARLCRYKTIDIFPAHSFPASFGLTNNQSFFAQASRYLCGF